MVNLQTRGLGAASVILTAVVALLVLAGTAGAFFSNVANVNQAFSNDLGRDESGNLNHAAIAGDPELSDSEMVGYGYGAVLDGVDDSFHVGATFSLDESYSYVVAFEWETGDAFARLLNWATGSDGENFYLFLSDADQTGDASLVWAYRDGAGVEQTWVITTLSPGQHSVGVSFDGVTATAHVDGALAGTPLVPATVLSVEHTMLDLFGYDEFPVVDGQEREVVGAAYEFRFYEDALGSSQMASLTDTSSGSHAVLGSEVILYDFEYVSTTGNSVADSAAAVMPIIIAVVALFGFVGMVFVAIRFRNT